jgi:putative methyltransferase (TIGR04325 family)
MGFMSGRVKYSFKQCIPAVLRRAGRLWLNSRRYRGRYHSWGEASAAATGYDAGNILERVINATRAVRDGTALWERDTVLFHEPIYHERLLDVLNAVAAEDGRLDVLDFGGALGSTWWQHRVRLTNPAPSRWSIVEQAGFVQAGRAEFQMGPLRFYKTVDECFSEGAPNVLLLSSVLPYLEYPHEILAGMGSENFSRIIIDRTGFVIRGDDWLTVQHVPASVYPASYPCWFFNRDKLIGALAGHWQVDDEWATFDAGGPKFEYRGLALKRRDRIVK